MSRRTFTPDQVTEMLERWHRGDSTSDVATAVGVDRKTVKKYADCALAAGMGCRSRLVERPEELDEALAAAVGSNEPTVLHVRVDPGYPLLY